jgi:D-2-hydroxyacid dehydrogenase (NADP+)
MKDLKLVVMRGPWADWLADCEAVSERLRAVVAPTEEQLLAEIPDADIVFGRLPREPFLAAKKLKWVQSIGVGFDTMLYAEMVESDVIITNTAGAYDASMAEHALALMLSWTRGVIASERNRRQRNSARDIPVSQLAGRRACVLGLGTIGRRISLTLHRMGMHVTGVDAQVTSVPEGVDELSDPDGMLAVLASSDYVAVALPLTGATRGLVDRTFFAAMPNHGYLVNVARGPIVNESDLIAALQSGEIAGAGLDVFEEEPLPDTSPLWDLENVVITPHLAGRSEEGRQNVLEIFCENLRRFTSGQPLMNIVDKRRGYVLQ